MPGQNAEMPPEMILRVHYEALVLLDLEEVWREVEFCPKFFFEPGLYFRRSVFPTQNPLKIFPYHTIMCWGHSRKTFQFRIFNKGGDPTTIQLVSPVGSEIEQIVLKAVKSLMEDMEKKGVSDAEFKNLCSTVRIPLFSKAPHLLTSGMAGVRERISGH